ncbi:putative ribonuclease H-like domain-containing protein [Tanacetum coccineum]
MTHLHPNRKFVPQAVLTRSGKINTTGASVNTVVRPVNTASSKTTVNYSRLILNAYKKGYSQVTKPFNKYSANKNSIFNKKLNTVRVKDTTARDRAVGNPQQKEYKEKGVIDSGCSRHMTGNKCYLTEYEDYDGGFVSFGDGKGRISRKGKIKTGTLDCDNVYFCKELKYNLFSVSQICVKKNNVLFTDTECLVLSSDLKLLDESQVLLRVLRKDNIYSVDPKSVVLTKGLTCLISKAIIDESNLWHRRLGHTNFKNINKLVRGNLVRGLPSKFFENNHSCVAYQKGKQHKASYKAKLMNSISKSLHMLYMDLFGPTNVKSLMKKSYCLVVTDDFNHKVKVIRCDNGTEFKNSVMNQFYEMKGIKREFSIARTPQHNGIAERKNRTLIEAARTIPPLIRKFDEKANEGYFVGYSVISKALRVFNKRTKIVEETLNIRFLENAPNVKGNEPDWLFDVDSLSKSMNYVPVVAGNQTNGIAGTKETLLQILKDGNVDAGKKAIKVDESEASDKGGNDEQDTRNLHHTLIHLYGTSDSTAQCSLRIYLFERFYLFKNESPLLHVPNVTPMHDTGIFGNAYDDKDVEEEVNMNNVVSSYAVPDGHSTKFLKDHLQDQSDWEFNQTSIQTSLNMNR